MITEKKNTLRPILESFHGIHLTAYLTNPVRMDELKSSLEKIIEESHQWLYGIQTHEERKKFLAPLEGLLADTRILEGIKGNIGIFRNENLFQILNIPIDVEPGLQIADSFHVKPILRWLQGDQDFLLLGFEKNATHLYLGGQHTFKFIDSTNEPEPYLWLNDWISELTKNTNPIIFLAGEPFRLEALRENLDYKNIAATPVADFFSTIYKPEICYEIRKRLSLEAKKTMQETLKEFRFAEEEKKTSKNIFQISKAVVQGKVKKLIVTDEINLFGKIDPESGNLLLHSKDLNHEDDCVLDDLAQMVLSQGGEVVIAKRKDIPNGRPILAILDDDDEDEVQHLSFQEELR